MALNEVVDDIEQQCTPLGLLGLRIFDDPTDRTQVRTDALRAAAAHPDVTPAAVLAELLARGWSSTDALTIASWYAGGQTGLADRPAASAPSVRQGNYRGIPRPAVKRLATRG